MDLSLSILKDIENDLYETYDSFSITNLDYDKFGEKLDISVMDFSLYNGLSGFAILLLSIYEITQDKKLLKRYYKLINYIAKNSIEYPMNDAFEGKFQALYPMILEKEITGDIKEKEYIEKLEEYARNVNIDDLEEIKHTDYVGGISSLICLLDRIESYDLKKLNKTLKIILKKKMEKEDFTIGIAHGISGKLMALADSKIKDKDIIDLLYKEEKEFFSKQDNFKIAYKWCWGLSGMIQARIYIEQKRSSLKSKLLTEQLVNNYIDLLKNVDMKNDSICHGISSVIITLILLYDKYNCNEYLKMAKRYASDMEIYHVLNEKYKVPAVKMYKSNGLYNGMSGIGWMYTYLHKRYRNIMTFDI